MPDKKKPWDISPSESRIEFEPFFKDSEYMSLSELDCKRNTYPFFSAGRPLVLIHNIGILHGDLRRQHIFYWAPAGRSGFIDFGGGRFAEPDPQVMATDFIVPFFDLETDQFLALVAGYARWSFLILDEKYPNFTAELLQHFGGTFTSLPIPRPDYLNVAEYFEKLSLRVDVQKDRIQLTSTIESSALMNLWDEHGDDLFIFCVSLVLLGLDCSFLFNTSGEALPASEDGRYLYQIFSQLYAGTPLPVGEAYDLDEIVIGLRLLKAIQEKLNFPNTDPDGDFRLRPYSQPNHLIASKLIPILNDFSAVSASRFMDKIIDGIDHFAAFFDTGSQKNSSTEWYAYSVDFAQFSQMFLQYSAIDCRLDEARYLKVCERHSKLSWERNLLADHNDTSKFMKDFSYAVSRSNANMRFFNNSVQLADEESTNAFWSLMWEALQTNRKVLLKCNRFLNENEEAGGLVDVLNPMIATAARLHIRIMQSHVSALMSLQELRELSLLMTEEDSKLNEEIEWVVDLANHLQQNSITSDSGKTLLLKGTELLSRYFK